MSSRIVPVIAGSTKVPVVIIFPALFILIRSVPPVDTAIVSALGKNTPVLESPDGVIDGSAVVPADTVVIPDTTRLDAVAIPNDGVTNTGLIANTLAPEPVSSVNAVARLAELKEPNDVVVLLDVIAPVRFGILVVVVAVPNTCGSLRGDT